LAGLLGIVVAIGGCGDDAKIKDLERKTTQQDTQIKEQQKEINKAHENESWWSKATMTVTCLWAFSVVVAFVAGLAMGSRARNDAHSQTETAATAEAQT
jgi:hypothetical protein